MRNILKSKKSIALFTKSLFVFFVFYTLFYFSAPLIIKKIAIDKLREEYGVTLALDSLEIEPLSANIKVKNLSLGHKSQKEPLVNCGFLDVNLGYYGLLKGTIAIDAITVDSMNLNLSRDANKTFNFQKIFPSHDDKKESKGIYFALNNINIQKTNIVFADDITKQKYELKNIELSLPFISNVPYETSIFMHPHFKATFNGANFEINGTTRPFAKDLKSEVELSFDDLNLSLANTFLPKDSELKSIAGFLSIKSKLSFEKSKTNKLTLKANASLRDMRAQTNDANLSIKSLKAQNLEADVSNMALKTYSLGSLHIEGVASYQQWIIDSFLIEAKNIQNRKDEPFEVKADVATKYGNLSCLASVKIKDKTVTIADGKVDMRQFALYTENKNKKLLGFDTFSINGIKAMYPENKVDIEGMALSGFYANVKITKDKSINLVKYFTKDKNASVQKTEVNGTESKPFDLTIQKFTLQGGRVDFEDRSLKHSFKTSLTDMTGSIGKLAIGKNQSSTIDLRANSGGYGRIAIGGDVVPQSENFALRLKAKTIDLPMTQFTPYTEKFIGYKIDSGSLGLDLDYKVVGRKLESNNKISLFGFNLGDEVESEGATKLPYKLALAILKDGNGNIDIELPVEGSLDDPDIKSGQVVWKFIIQLVTKIIKSPFSAIAGVFGGGEEYSYAAFAAGSAALDAVEMTKLQKTAEIINKKPTLHVELQGFVDSEKDVIGYKENELNKKLVSAKTKGLKSTATLKVEPVEYEKYLKEVYDSEKFPKPKNMLGLNKSLSANDMKTLIITHVTVGKKELETLSRQRAEHVMAELVKNGVAKERISISDKELSAPEPKEKAPNSRVEIGFSH